MAHRILGSRFYAYRTPAWHRLGTVSQVPLDAMTAFEKAGALYDVITADLVARLDDGRTVAVPSRRAVVRPPIPERPYYETIGVVSSEYQVIQNRDVALALQPLSIEWPVETVGVLGRGEMVFCTLRAGSYAVGGHEQEQLAEYFLAFERKDGRGALVLQYTPVRVVCANTLSIALSSRSGLRMHVAHRSGARVDLQQAISAMASLRLRQEQHRAAFEQLAAATLVEQQVEQILRAAWPDPQRTARQLAAEQADDDGAVLSDEARQHLRRSDLWYASQASFVQSLRSTGLQRYYELADDASLLAPAVRWTAWHALQAVTEIEDWRERAINAQSEADLYASTVFGSRAQAKSRAYEEALAIASAL